MEANIKLLAKFFSIRVEFLLESGKKKVGINGIKVELLFDYDP